MPAAHARTGHARAGCGPHSPLGHGTAGLDGDSGGGGLVFQHRRFSVLPGNAGRADRDGPGCDLPAFHCVVRAVGPDRPDLFVLRRGVTWPCAVLYPQLWSDPADARAQAQRELPPVAGQLRFYQSLAVLIPVGGTGLLIFAAPNQLTVSYRFLLIALLVLGAAGFGLATMLVHRLENVIVRLTGERVRK